MKGKVKFFNRGKGFGFIQGDDGKDYFVHYTALREGVSIDENDRVSFDPVEGDRGWKAENVELSTDDEAPAEDETSEEEAPAEEETSEEAPVEEPAEEEAQEEEKPEEEAPAEEPAEEPEEEKSEEDESSEEEEKKEE